MITFRYLDGDGKDISHTPYAMADCSEVHAVQDGQLLVSVRDVSTQGEYYQRWVFVGGSLIVDWSQMAIEFEAWQDAIAEYEHVYPELTQ